MQSYFLLSFLLFISHLGFWNRVLLFSRLAHAILLAAWALKYTRANCVCAMGVLKRTRLVSLCSVASNSLENPA